MKQQLTDPSQNGKTKLVRQLKPGFFGFLCLYSYHYKLIDQLLKKYIPDSDYRDNHIEAIFRGPFSLNLKETDNPETIWHSLLQSTYQYVGDNILPEHKTNDLAKDIELLKQVFAEIATLPPYYQKPLKSHLHFQSLHQIIDEHKLNTTPRNLCFMNKRAITQLINVLKKKNKQEAIVFFHEFFCKQI
jgi:hypothetical protein